MKYCYGPCQFSSFYGIFFSLCFCVCFCDRMCAEVCIGMYSYSVRGKSPALTMSLYYTCTISKINLIKSKIQCIEIAPVSFILLYFLALFTAVAGQGGANLKYFIRHTVGQFNPSLALPIVFPMCQLAYKSGYRYNYYYLFILLYFILYYFISFYLILFIYLFIHFLKIYLQCLRW